MICYVQNCKFGDVINCLPILYGRYQQTGIKDVMLVSEKYASVLSGCSYVHPEVWRGDWTDLAGAMTQAKSKYKNVTQLSTYGKGFTLTKKTPSFALEQFRLAEMDGYYGTLPLIFDKRDARRETALVDKYVKPGHKFILVADYSESSPFDQSLNLVSLIVDNFDDKYQIIKLSEVRAEFIYDLLGLYDKASALVSIETVHLHLSAASAVPVVALVTDHPEIWHGTPWRKQFVAHVRYGEYEQRQAEIVEALKTALTGWPVPQIKITGRGGYNLSVIDWQDERLGVYRYHPSPEHWRTQLALWDGKQVRKVNPPEEFKEHSLEDGRFFIHQDKLHLAYVVSQAPANIFQCVMQHGELEPVGDNYRIVNHYQPKYGRNDFSGFEKNWSFFTYGDILYAAYNRSPEQIVLQIAQDKVQMEHRSKTPEWSTGQMRGGTYPIPYKGLWLQFFHTLKRTKGQAYWWSYSMGALLMETMPPFQIVAVSRSPIMRGFEQYFANHKFWKPRVLIPYGAVQLGDEFLVSIGLNDSATATVQLKERDLNL